MGVKKEKKDMGQFFKKVNSLKTQSNDCENLGIIQNMYRKLSLNELAANGIKISVRNKIIDMIKLEKNQTQEH